MIEDLPEDENGPRYIAMSGSNAPQSRHRNDYDEDQSNSFVITSQGGKKQLSSAAKRAQSTLRPTNVGGPSLGPANVSAFVQQKPTATERQGGRRLVRAQSQLRGGNGGRPKATMAAAVKIKTYRQEGERAGAQ